MDEQTLTHEERILRAVRRALTLVVKDTATPPGVAHPLKDTTIEALRECLALISARERELAEAAGRPQAARPRFADEPRPPGTAVVKFTRPRKDKPKS